MTSTQLLMTRDESGQNTFGLEFTNNKFGCQLSTGAAQSITVPSDCEKWLAVFSYEPGASVFVAKNATATTPGATMGSVNVELNPAARAVLAGDTISLITPGANAYVGIALYAIP